MFIQIQPESSIPIYKQIMDHIEHAVASQRLKENDKLPSVRELAKQLVVNPNTVAKAYRELERNNVVRTHKGKGVFVMVTQDVYTENEKKRLVGEKMAPAIVEGLNLGMNFDEIRNVLEEKIAEFKNIKEIDHE
ncbi:GntR family transcriptional regulator [Candidatus Uabimicrobium amorphum]|uniref:GntR family transcriptional regulator n=1 Tax=Uabimicrobium amorphum TaxID=2596890 RepID=A0A5S9F2M9_UABAM|nr:GntR family transcriptional regulator [Candidatus Uabimicrobium amorphum]BBM83283.1 GntR family transcriptional regulator [Candidatus Uabimicrobium amorphum]